MRISKTNKRGYGDDEVKDKLIRLQAKYGSDAKVGARLGVSRQAIHQLRMKFGIKPKSTKAEKAKRNRGIRFLYRQGMSVAYLAKGTSLSLTHIYKILKDGR